MAFLLRFPRTLPYVVILPKPHSPGKCRLLWLFGFECLEFRSRLFPVSGIAVDLELERANLPVRLREVGVGLRVEKLRARLVQRLLQLVDLLLGRLDALLELLELRGDLRALRSALLPELLLGKLPRFLTLPRLLTPDPCPLTPIDSFGGL